MLPSCTGSTRASAECSRSIHFTYQDPSGKHSGRSRSGSVVIPLSCRLWKPVPSHGRTAPKPGSTPRSSAFTSSFSRPVLLIPSNAGKTDALSEVSTAFHSARPFSGKACFPAKPMPTGGSGSSGRTPEKIGLFASGHPVPDPPSGTVWRYRNSKGYLPSATGHGAPDWRNP